LTATARGYIFTRMGTNIALKIAILEAGRSQFEVAGAVGIHESRLSQIIRGHRTASEQERQRLAAELRVP
jgi:transcriptional regulator with XRE-family HTH domain